VEREEALISMLGAAPVFSIPAEPKATRKPTTQVAKMTVRHNGTGTVESRRGFIIPASKGSVGAAQPSIPDVLIVRMTK
jgi:hypothetical protein